MNTADASLGRLLSSLADALREEAAETQAFDRFLRDLLVDGQPYARVAQGSSLWKTARQKRLTGSNFGTAAGCSPFCTPRSLWQYQCGHLVEPDGVQRAWSGNDNTERGTQNEPSVVAAYCRLTGNAVEPAGLFLHPQHEFLAASPDGMLAGGGLLEVKNPRKLHESVPLHYLCQVQGQLACSGREWAHFFSFSTDERGGAWK